MVQTFGTFKSIADRRDRDAIDKTIAAAANQETPLTDAARLPVATHQERVNAQMFKAIEILGRKLDRVDDERSLLTRRLALIESSASIDEKTGKLYLPVVTDGAAPVVQHITTAVPKWMVGLTALSTMTAIIALALVALRPVPTALTPEQLAIINALVETRMGALNGPLAPQSENAQSWQPVELTEATAVPAEDFPLAESNTSEALPELTPAPADGADTATVTAAASETGAPESATTETKTTPTVPAATEAPVELAAAVTAPAVPARPAAKAEAKTETNDQVPPPLVAGLDIGRDQNLPASLLAVETRAMEGIPAAQHDLATIYAAGKQAPQDYKRAAYWFAQAAEGGIANAHYNLGVMFQQGLGVKKDTNKALGWYEKAAELGHPEAMYNLGIAYIEGVGTTRNVERGISFFEQAADTGVAQAAYNLGVLYESGFAGPIDLATAQSWYKKAAAEDHTEAREALARLDSQMERAPALSVADMVEPGDSPLEQGDTTPPEDTAYKNDLVAKIQRALIDRGFLPAPATGVMDARTEDAIRAWQRGQNMTVDGIPSLTLLGDITKTPTDN